MKYAVTTTDGREGSIRFRFGYPSSETGALDHGGEGGVKGVGGGGDGGDKGDENQFNALPSAKIVLITFPIQGGDAMKFLVKRYLETHGDGGSTSEGVEGMQGEGTTGSVGGKKPVRWILLGSTGIWGSPGSRRGAANKDTSETVVAASGGSNTSTTPGSARTALNTSASATHATATSPPTTNTPSDNDTTSSTAPPATTTTTTSAFHYTTPSSPITNPSPRYHAEQTLLSLSLPNTNAHLNIEATVLNLAGLHGEPHRTKRIFELAVPKTKEGVGEKGSVHFVNGWDVAALIVRICLDVCGEKESGLESDDVVVADGNENTTVDSGKDRVTNGAWENLKGKRWIVCDCRVYDWWDIIWDNAEHLQSLLDESANTAPIRGSATSPGKTGVLTSSSGMPSSGWTYRKWILELMLDRDVQSLPRPVEMLGRALDGRDVWREAGVVPVGRKFEWPAQ